MKTEPNNRKSRRLAPAENFDALPRAAHVRLPTVLSLCGCSSATAWRMVKRGQLPAPKKLSTRVVAWNVGELRDVLGA